MMETFQMPQPVTEKSFKVSQSFRVCVMLLTMACTYSTQVQAARVVAMVGSMQINRGGLSEPVVVGTRLRQGDEFASAPGAEAVVRFDDGARMALRAESVLQVKALRQTGPLSKRKKAIRLVKGSLRYISAKVSQHHHVSFETSTATIGIRGTDIEIAVAEESINEEPSGTYLKVNTGLATLTAGDGTLVSVDPGQVAFGGEPDLVPRGAGGVKRPSARKVAGSVGLFGVGSLDQLMK